jgi:hypothetical protein
MASRWRTLGAPKTRRLTAGAALFAILTLGMTAISVPVAFGQARPAASAGQGPELKLIASVRTIDAASYGKGRNAVVFFDPGIWLGSLHSAFQLDVKRASYAEPLTVTQAIKSTSGATVARRPLPASILDSWNGLKDFLYIVVRTKKGKIVDRRSLAVCPDSYETSRTNPGSAVTSNYPEECSPGDPFGIGEVWGIARGWAIDPISFLLYRELKVGTYKVTVSIARKDRAVFGISARDATARVTLKVVSPSDCDGVVVCAAKAARPPAHFISTARTRKHGTLPSLPAVQTMNNPPASVLPDLIPLPSWGISTVHVKKSGDYLDFGATVWIAGHGPLDVEAFRENSSGTMVAYQYFWKGNRLIGRARVGTMGFSGYNAWHFQQFAQYMLLNAKKHVVVRSRKIGFCIAPTDGVDLLLRHAVWRPEYTGIAGNCGDPTALWVQELLPLGWGDTYFQSVPHQSFDISKIPNGTYYIEIIANPEHLLHEVTTANDVSLRKVIIGGTPGHRTVRVPAIHGIDAEH